jgi:hypothetical protein
MLTAEVPSAVETPLSGRRPYVGVVFVHGIGDQRNYESTAELVESIDDWVSASYRDGSDSITDPRLKTKTRRELLRGSPNDESITYIQADHDKTRVRFYEVYWAPAAAPGTPALGSFVWLMRQILRPLGVLRAHWRTYARLRRADLVRYGRKWAGSGKKQADDLEQFDSDLSLLAKLYGEFVSTRDSRQQRFKQFLEYVATREQKDERRIRLQKTARRWRWFHFRTQLWSLALLLSVGVTVCACILLMAAMAIKLLAWTSGTSVLARLFPLGSLEPNISNAVAVIAVLLSMLGIRRFFSDYIGDIRQFVTYEETQPLYERRKKILETSDKVLRHVLEDELCDRVVVVSHSLGTAIALESILRLRAANQATQPDADDEQIMTRPLSLLKLQHLITFGSPIDKINYFFAAIGSPTRSYEQMIEQLRGDISSVPFSRPGKQPYIHWINFWDQGDPISGPIESVAGTIIREQHVDNVQVASYLWPDPAGSHSGYFRHRDVISRIFGVVFRNDVTFLMPPRESSGRPLWQWVGPGRRSKVQQLMLATIPVTVALLVWTTVAIVVPAAGPPPVGYLGAVLLILIGGGLIQRRLELHTEDVSDAPVKGR